MFCMIMDESLSRFEEGVACYEKGDYRDAIAAFDKAVTINPAMAEAWNNRGLALVQTGQYKEALHSVDKALSLNPGYEKARNAREIVLELMKNEKNGDPLPGSAKLSPAIKAGLLIIAVAGIVLAASISWGYFHSSSANGLRDIPVAGSQLPGADRQVPVENGVIPPGKGQFVFNDSLGNADRPITVYTYRPAAWNTSGPILFVMPGAGREGSSPRETWIPYAEKYSSIVIVPEFSQHYYPGDLWYPLGYTYDDSDWKPKANWTFSAIDHLFDYVREKNGATRNTYLLDGHSAGAQFVHRMVTFLPEAKFSRAVAANAGVYVQPDFTIPYPYGLKDSPQYASNLPEVFSRNLIIMSGGADTNPNETSLANSPLAEAQGRTRFERAKTYFTGAQAEADRLHIPLNWEYHVVPGVGHDEAGMAGPSAVYLFSGSS
jgi:tetratricopeptide (TPR) repeat protein